MLLTFGCGREGRITNFALTRAQTAAAEPTSEPTPAPTPEPAPEPTPRNPAPAAPAQPAGPLPTQGIPSTNLPGGPDGEDDTKHDSGVRGRVMAGDRPVADAVVFVKGDGFQSNSYTGPGGRFLVEAPSGSYLVGARATNGVVRCDDQTVKVEETSFTTITVHCSVTGG
jgi:hypothetical protein